MSTRSYPGTQVFQRIKSPFTPVLVHTIHKSEGFPPTTYHPPRTRHAHPTTSHMSKVQPRVVRVQQVATPLFKNCISVSHYRSHVPSRFCLNCKSFKSSHKPSSPPRRERYGKCKASLCSKQILVSQDHLFEQVFVSCVWVLPERFKHVHSCRGTWDAGLDFQLCDFGDDRCGHVDHQSSLLACCVHEGDEYDLYKLLE